MIYLFTDFSYQGPYVGELKSVLEAGKSPGQSIIDLMHDAPKFNSVASAYLLAALSQRFQPGDACLGVVDPGVGNEQRRPIIIEADGVIYSGPDNGLFSQIIARAKTVVVNEVIWRPEQLSNSFHGRDLFSPALLKVLNREELALRQIAEQDLIGADWASDLDKVIYIDGFGNLITGRRAMTMSNKQVIHIAGHEVEYAETFFAQERGKPFWYVNSMGLVEIAVNQGTADRYFGVEVGKTYSVLS